MRKNYEIVNALTVHREIIYIFCTNSGKKVANIFLQLHL